MKTHFGILSNIYRVMLPLVSLFIITTMCTNSTPDGTRTNTIPVEGVVHPSWAADAVIYELNVRQYSPDGSFNAVTKDIPRLKELGVDILWLMPVHPIGEKNRKGELGSYYSVKDYRAVNPEFGSMEDFKNLVASCHEMDIKVIIDWVPNHSAWDNALVEEHPDWYVKNEDGELASPFDWTDVVQFDYDNEELRQYMIESLKFWIEETYIDGYRFDVAHMVPVDFWDEVRRSLSPLKEVFLLAEADQPWLHKKAMDMSYDWKFHHIMNEVASGVATVPDIKKHFTYVDSAYPENSILMQFTSNHDENSWNGTVYERMGHNMKSFAALTFTIPGMPLIYNGQEACMDKRLLFFEKDPIEWKECELFEFYQRLIQLRKENPALWSEGFGGGMEILNIGDDNKVFAFIRSKDNNQVLAIFNFSDEAVNVTYPENMNLKSFVEYFTGEKIKEYGKKTMDLNPWGFKIFVK